MLFQNQKLALAKVLETITNNCYVELYKDADEFIDSFLGELNDFVVAELIDRPNVYEESSDPLQDYDRMISLMKIVSSKYENAKKKYCDKHIVIAMPFELGHLVEELK